MTQRLRHNGGRSTAARRRRVFPEACSSVRFAYGLQEWALGGLAPAARSRLLSTVDDRAKETPVRREPAPGTILLREWHGVNHRVTVLEGGVEYRGQRYRSLSEVARLITGSRWSGPLFFGLRQRMPE